MDSKQPSKRVDFLCLQQEDYGKVGGLDLKETTKVVERSFFLHGNNFFIIMSMPSYMGCEQLADELRERDLPGRVNTTASKRIPSPMDARSWRTSFRPMSWRLRMRLGLNHGGQNG